MTTGLRKIERVTAKRGYKLSVMWTDGQQLLVDFSTDIKGGRVWAPLADETLFSKARVSHDGHAVEWPEPADDDGEPRIDIDAEGLYRLAVQQLASPHVGLMARS
jgi:hypothetical protein